ncbi:MAG: Ldh family oxidoreductase, partial [Anaerolineae bacterium]|nr:Ldh family oxidoreductase [Anaerolineae bacterium]
DIEWFMSVDVFKARMDDFIQQIKSAKLRPGFSEILIPGELDHRREQEYRKNGAQLDADVFDELSRLAQDLSVPFPFKREVIPS